MPFSLKTFRKGMVCKYGEKNDNLVRVSIGLRPKPQNFNK